MFKWRIIPKHLRKEEPAPRGTYKDWKALLAEEGEHRCVYCAIPDSRLGGVYCFHVEHFEPKSKAPARINDWSNLFYSCPICNVFKGNDWPSRESPVAYADPSLVDYETLFLRRPGGIIEGQTPAAGYMLERLYLNRPQLVLEREEAELRSRLAEAREILRLLAPIAKAHGQTATRKLMDCYEQLSSTSAIAENLWFTTPYEAADVRRENR
jgi:hypothetical protein